MAKPLSPKLEAFYKKLSVGSALFCLIVSLFSHSTTLKAHESEVFEVTEEIETTQAVSQESFGLDETQQVYDDRMLKRVEFLQNIRDALKATQKDLYDVNVNVRDANGRLTDTQVQVTTLQDQLANLDRQIKSTEDLILNVSIQIGQKENELVVLFEDMEIKKAAIENQKKMLMEYLKTIYEQESSVTDTMTGNDDINIAKLLLSDESVGEQLQEIKYFNVLEQTGHQIFDKLETLMKDLENEQKDLEDKKSKLGALYERLSQERENLEVQKNAKKKLLEDTKGEEKIYQQLLEESKAQQAQIQEDIKTLRDNLKFIQEKMEEMGDDFDPEAFKSLFNSNGEKISVYEYINSTKNSEFTPRWPVSPSRGISAYFHDPSYARAFGVQHSAIDIRATQGTNIRAPADGVVYKVRDNGYGYSYIILAHAGGFMTVFGHVSEIKVEAGEKVFAGQTIGLSGGTPGTKGAGVMTTGAHLHFEVMQGGKYVDPLDYLPLSLLPIDSLPEKYKSRVTGDPTKVRRVKEGEDAFRTDEEMTQYIETSGAIEGTVQDGASNNAGIEDIVRVETTP